MTLNKNAIMNLEGEGGVTVLKKVRFIIAFISLSICLCLMSTTYSRYVADATGNIETLFAKWQILVNTNDITSGSGSSISFTPVIEENEYTADNVIAPSSKGYFDIDIDPTNVDVSFNYTISLSIENENVPDLMITKYVIIPTSHNPEDPLEVIDLHDNFITNTLIYDKTTTDFQFEPFTIRVYFEWYEGAGELMADEDDTAIGHQAATEGVTFKLNADILFEQVFE